MKDEQYWWSSSEQRHIAVGDMEEGHAKNALRIMLRQKEEDTTPEQPKPRIRILIDDDEYLLCKPYGE